MDPLNGFDSQGLILQGPSRGPEESIERLAVNPVLQAAGERTAASCHFARHRVPLCEIPIEGLHMQTSLFFSIYTKLLSKWIH